MDVEKMIDDTGETNIYFTRGHKNPDEFLQQASSQWDVDCVYRCVRRGYARWIPNEELGLCFHLCGRGRGAFMVTYSDCTRCGKFDECNEIKADLIKR